MYLASRQRWLQNVGRVHPAGRVASTYQGVYLVDEHDYFRIATQLLHHALDALLELSSVLGAGHHACHVESNDTSVLQEVADFMARDALGQPFDDGTLAHARFTY